METKDDIQHLKQLRPLVIVAGPTATGKSRAAVLISRRIGGSVISADSMQVYRGMDIGTAKITEAEMEGIPHYLIDIIEPYEEWNVVRFQKECERSIEQIYSEGRIPVLCGGTGFYIQSVLRGIDFSETDENGQYRRELTELCSLKGLDFLHSMLAEVDPASASVIHPNNVKRVIRALEFHHLTGQRISEHNEQQSQRPDAYDAVFFVLDRKRPIRTSRIRERVDQMFRNGLVDEVVRLEASGLTEKNISMQGIGYKEILRARRDGTDMDAAREEIKMNSIHFAKRQSTWFRREKNTINIDPDLFESETSMIDFMEAEIRKKFKSDNDGE